jgi:hypothetical protein
LFFPPGRYYFSQPAYCGFQCGHANLEIECRGATFYDVGTGEQGLFNRNIWGMYSLSAIPFAWLNSYLNMASAIVTAKDLTKLALDFSVNQWVAICGIDTQNTPGAGQGSFPPSQHYCEYHKITAIDTVVLPILLLVLV